MVQSQERYKAARSSLYFFTTNQPIPFHFHPFCFSLYLIAVDRFALVSFFDKLFFALFYICYIQSLGMYLCQSSGSVLA